MCATMRSRTYRVIISFLIIIVTLAIYWQVRDHDFINFDDDVYVTENHFVRKGLTKAGLSWAFSSSHGSNWHPLTTISHMIDVSLFGLEPGYHHLVNVFIHILNTLLLLYVLNIMTGEFWKSAFVAAIFALHPLHVESVAWIAERKDVLSAFFGFLTIWAYVQYVLKSTLHKYLVMMLLFALGLLSKPMLVTLPFVLILIDIWPLERLTVGPRSAPSNNGRVSESQNLWSTIKQISLYKSVGEKIPLFMLSATSSIITYFVQAHTGAVRALDQIALDRRIANALTSYTDYIEKMFVPINLSILYPFPSNISPWHVAISTFVLMIITFLSLRYFRKKPYFFTGWLWYLGTLVPVIGIVQVGSQAMADRYTYIPLIGLFIIVAWGVPDLLKKLPAKKSILSGAAVLIILIVSVISWNQVSCWKDSTTLFRHAIDVTENNMTAHLNLGTAMEKKGQLDEAMRQYLYILRLSPHNMMAHNNLGTIYQIRGNIDKAVQHYQRVLEIDPDVVKVRNNLGVIFAQQGNYARAIEEFNKALKIDPNYQPARNNLKSLLNSQVPADHKK